MSAFSDASDVEGFIDDLAEALHRTISEIIGSDVIFVAAVQGPAAGAGFPLMAAADIVVASRSARFSVGYTRVGLSIDGGTSLLTHSLGLHRTLRLALLNDAVSADEAFQAGLVARVCEDEGLSATVEEMASRLAAGPAAAQAATKRLIRTTAEPAPESRMRAETRSIRRRAAEPEGREGVRAFLDKRDPTFNDPV